MNEKKIVEDKKKKAIQAGLALWLFNLLFVTLISNIFSSIGIFTIFVAILHQSVWKTITLVGLIQFMYGYVMLFCIMAVIRFIKKDSDILE